MKENKLVINKIEPMVVPLYSPNGELMGMVNEFELNDFLIQIKKNYVDGYYVIFNEQILPILINGKIKRPPKGFFDLIDEQLNQLMGF